MGKSDEKQTKKRAHKNTGKSKHKGTDRESKHKKQSSLDTLGSSPLATTFEATHDGGVRHSQWCELFRHMCEYKIQFGHCRVPFKYSANLKLGYWVAKQRASYKKNTEEKSTSMTAEHIRALNGIGFEWGTSQTEWSVRFQQLREFKVQFGHCLVSQRYAANPKLGRWISKQRSNYRLYQDGKPSPMTGERIRELESVGFK
jgi:hypothetical protein